MDMEKMVKLAETFLGPVDPRILGWVYDRIKVIPWVRDKLEGEYDSMLEGIEEDLKPYGREFTTYAKLPAEGRGRGEILSEIETLTEREESTWRDGYVSGAVYHGDQSHIDFLNEVYALNSQCNPLHADLWPRNVKFEAEIVSMTAQMLGAGQTPDDIVGTVTSGGTESILLAMKSYRDRARAERGIRRPEMIIPVTAHAAFEKAGQYFGMEIVRVPVDHMYRADVTAVRKAIGRNTVVIVGSAPSFPHGAIDPIGQLAALAKERGIGFHTDACLGGFVLPWAERLGAPVPPFDFRVPGVTSMSADTHKYGYAAKGTSVVMYRGVDLRHYQFYKTTDWPGGMYFSPTLAGSRPGALSAACWAAMLSIGEAGYLEATKRILEAAKTIRAGVESIPALRVMGDPLWVIAFGSDTLDIYHVMEHMTKRGWVLNGLHKPACVHIAVTLRHAEEGVAERFVDDLKASVAAVEAEPHEKGGMAPIYGMAATLPVRGLVGDMLLKYMDLLYKI